jgi:hypothetical protein
MRKLKIGHHRDGGVELPARPLQRGADLRHPLRDDLPVGRGRRAERSVQRLLDVLADGHALGARADSRDDDIAAGLRWQHFPPGLRPRLSEWGILLPGADPFEIGDPLLDIFDLDVDARIAPNPWSAARSLRSASRRLWAASSTSRAALSTSITSLRSIERHAG